MDTEASVYSRTFDANKNSKAYRPDIQPMVWIDLNANTMTFWFYTFNLIINKILSCFIFLDVICSFV